MLETKELNCDLCVIGGGMSGLCAAISAAREGIKVVLMHERPVLGGNASSEIRMWICGASGKDNRETGILEEIALENLYRNPTKSYAIWDSVLFDFVKREENITLLLNCTCMDAECEDGSFEYNRERKIKSVTGYQMTTQKFYKVNASFFCDSSGDSILAPLTNAEFMLGRESKDCFNEDSTLTESDTMTMGMSCLIQGRETNENISYIPPRFATKLTKKDFENRDPHLEYDSENFWYLELGGNRDTISDTEELRDELLGLATGTWDYIKNSGCFDADKWELDFLGFLPGKRESRRMVGEYIITQKDISQGFVFDDEIAFGGWPLDDHFPGGFYHRGVPNTYFPTPAPYSIPYRALYSKNIENLFFAGRNISMTHLAMSSIRVMATCGLLGEAVGKASAIAVKEKTTPHGVYLKHISHLQELLQNEDSFLPSRTRRISDICKNTVLSGASDVIRNAQDRPHKIYNTTEENGIERVKKDTPVTYILNKKEKISSVHIVFSSDLNRETLPGSECERIHSTRANTKLSSPQMHLPHTLCKSFTLFGENNGEKEILLDIENNLKRSYHLKLEKEYEKLTLIPHTNHANTDEIELISFDFN